MLRDMEELLNSVYDLETKDYLIIIFSLPLLIIDLIEKVITSFFCDLQKNYCSKNNDYNLFIGSIRITI